MRYNPMTYGYGTAEGDEREELMKRVSLQDLVGCKIVRVDDDCCNAVVIEVEDGRQFSLETERMLPSVEVYEIVSYER